MTFAIYLGIKYFLAKFGKTFSGAGDITTRPWKPLQGQVVVSPAPANHYQGRVAPPAAPGNH